LGAAVDLADQTKVWVAGEYARVEGGSEWGTWIAEIQLPWCRDVVAKQEGGFTSRS